MGILNIEMAKGYAKSGRGGSPPTLGYSSGDWVPLRPLVHQSVSLNMDEQNSETGIVPVDSSTHLQTMIGSEIVLGSVSDEMLIEADKYLGRLKSQIRQEQVRRLEEKYGGKRKELIQLQKNFPCECDSWHDSEESIKKAIVAMREWHEKMGQLRKECSPLLKVKEIPTLGYGGIVNRGECGICGSGHSEWIYWRYRPSWQEMPGAPVEPAYHYYKCNHCGCADNITGDRTEMICGVDLAGQPLYAGMTTREVAEICVCDEPDYGIWECQNPECVYERDFY